uniref:Uncharacterized protein n=1 Tax=Arundo donax TaxID=35708 RepID=A0A0A9BRR2_ARUDO
MGTLHRWTPNPEVDCIYTLSLAQQLLYHLTQIVFLTASMRRRVK